MTNKVEGCELTTYVSLTLITVEPILKKKPTMNEDYVIWEEKVVL